MRTTQGSQRPTKQFAGGNASTAADRIRGIQRALPRTHFPDSLQKPLLAHVDLHATTPQQYRDQQHLEICPNGSVQSCVGTKPAQHGKKTRRNVDLSHVRTMTQISELRFSNSMLHLPSPFTQPNTSKNAGVHTIQDDRLKHSTNKPVNTYKWLQGARRYQPALRPGTTPRQCLPG